MRVMMGVLKSKDGVYYARKKVPPKLEQTVLTVLGASRSRESWLKRSLRTKDLREANIKAKSVLMEFDRVLASAEGLLQDAPLATDLSESRDRAHRRLPVRDHARRDDEVRRDGTGSVELFRGVGQSSSAKLVFHLDRLEIGDQAGLRPV